HALQDSLYDRDGTARQRFHETRRLLWSRRAVVNRLGILEGDRGPQLSFHHRPVASSLPYFPTKSRRKYVKSNSGATTKIRTDLGDQWSAVRVHAPRAFAKSGIINR